MTYDLRLVAQLARIEPVGVELAGVEDTSGERPCAFDGACTRIERLCAAWRLVCHQAVVDAEHTRYVVHPTPRPQVPMFQHASQGLHPPFRVEYRVACVYQRPLHSIFINRSDGS